MLFNTYEFIFVFLPIVISVFSMLSRDSMLKHRIVALIGFSLVFYASWNPLYLPLFLFSVGANYLGASLLLKCDIRFRQLLLIGFISGNLALLFLFKYQSSILGWWTTFANWPDKGIALGVPLAISFFTFQQLSFLIDVYRDPRRLGTISFKEYLLFVAFFPHLVAGPIVHYAELIPQFRRDQGLRITKQNLVVGTSIFTFGLFKKVVFGDNLATLSDPVFSAAAAGYVPKLSLGWIAALAYTFQIYFDFSGYSDMAIGLSRLFGVRMPINFFSPYKATSITEFWKRWHMTLTRFFNEYVYSPWSIFITRACIRKHRGKFITFLMTIFVPTLGTFVLVGAWHGTGAHYLLFGGLHGVALSVSRGWRELRLPRIHPFIGWGFTMVFFIVTVVIFRAADLHAAWTMYAGMFGHGSASNTPLPLLSNLFILGLGIGVCFFMPNVYELMVRYRPAFRIGIHGIRRNGSPWFRWRPNSAWAMLNGACFALAIFGLYSVSPFIYMQF